MEAEACIKLKKQQPAANSDEDTDDGSLSGDEDQVLTVAEKLKMNSNKRRKVVVTTTQQQQQEQQSTKGYIDVGTIICATSNCCERLFLEAKYIMLPHRRGMSPILFEALLYCLKKNKSFWNASTVARAMKMKEDELQEELAQDDDTFYDHEE